MNAGEDTGLRMPASVPLTRVALVYVERRLNLWLRFGQPLRVLKLDGLRRMAVFMPGAIFCRVYWQSNAYGTVVWQVMVLRAANPLETVNRLSGVLPGAQILLSVGGEARVNSVLQQIDAIDAIGIDPATVSAAYWRTLNNRLAAHMPAPIYTPEQHAAHLAGESLQ